MASITCRRRIDASGACVSARRPAHRRPTHGAALIGAGLAVLAATWAPLYAAVPAGERVEPTAAQRRATSLVTRLIAGHHYQPAKLDDTLSSRILERYVERLDPNRMYLTATDVGGFMESRTRVDDWLRETRLEPAFEVFTKFRARLIQRLDHALELLEVKFDYTVDETYLLDRSETPWAADEAQMTDLWRKRVKNDILSLRMAGSDEDAIKQTLKKRYEALMDRAAHFDSEDVFELFMNAYAASVDPHTAYLSPRASENFRIHMSLSLEGIGARLQRDNEFVLVVDVIAGGPADTNGQVHAGDRIIGVAQGEDGEVVDVIGWPLDDVVDLIRGPRNSIVRLKLLPKDTGLKGPPMEVAIKRDKVTLENQAAKSTVIEAGSSALRIGAVRIPSFYADDQARARGDKKYRSTTRDVRTLVEALASDNVDGMVIDLRGNGGGALTEAIALTGLFIESGPVVQIKDSGGRLTIKRDPDPDIAYTGPLAVLVDRFSASASEIFAAAIQDYGRGIVLGEPTHGKGTVQSVVDLNRLVRDDGARLGQLKLTTAQFFRINGEGTQIRGVLPDIEFPTAAFLDDLGEKSYDNALPWQAIPATGFDRVIASWPDLGGVRAEHERRSADNPDMREILRTAQAQHDARQSTSVSLNETTRREEFEAATEAAEAARKESEKSDDENAQSDNASLVRERYRLDDALVGEAANILADLLASGIPGHVGGVAHTGKPEAATN
ncbi:MAG: carboxy terminal-processing peptidase [Gammaproteobacteria bacterium]